MVTQRLNGRLSAFISRPTRKPNGSTAHSPYRLPGGHRQSSSARRVGGEATSRPHENHGFPRLSLTVLQLSAHSRFDFFQGFPSHQVNWWPAVTIRHKFFPSRFIKWRPAAEMYFLCNMFSFFVPGYRDRPRAPRPPCRFRARFRCRNRNVS